MRHVRRRLGSSAPVRVLNFDWHGTMGQLGEERAVEAFWAFCGQLVQQARAGRGLPAGLSALLQGLQYAGEESRGCCAGTAGAA